MCPSSTSTAPCPCSARRQNNSCLTSRPKNPKSSLHQTAILILAVQVFCAPSLSELCCRGRWSWHLCICLLLGQLNTRQLSIASYLNNNTTGSDIYILYIYCHVVFSMHVMMEDECKCTGIPKIVWRGRQAQMHHKKDDKNALSFPAFQWLEQGRGIDPRDITFLETNV